MLLRAEPHAGRGLGGLERYLELEVAHQGLLIADLGGLGQVASLDDMFLEDRTLAPYEPIATLGIEWVTTEQALLVGRLECRYWPDAAADHESARFGVLDLAGNFSGWTEVELQIPSLEEAQAVDEADRAAAYERTFGPRDGRPSVCAFQAAPCAGVGSGLTLALLGAIACARRWRRHRR